MLVDNDSDTVDTLAIGLGFQWKDAIVVTAGDGDTALQLFRRERPDLVMLEADLPGRSGYEVVREIRQTSDVPIVMLAARSEELDEVRGYEMGADAYLPKPFRPLALLARIKAVLRRASMHPPVRTSRNLLFRGLVIDLRNNRVMVQGELVKLTPVEYRLLCCLARHAGSVVAHRVLLSHACRLEQKSTVANLKVFISRLRAKIESPGGQRYIETVRGFGYRFVGEEVRT